MVILLVSDSGKGIDKNEQERVFDRFYKSANNKKKGSGIGLALVKELVESMQGTIKIKPSEIGCNFQVKLPIQKINKIKPISANQIDENNSQLESINSDGTKPKLLLVEDEPELLIYTQSLLKNDFEVLTAINGEDAILKLENTLPNIIISDVMMPKMNGFELAKLVKESEEYRHIPFILLTAKNDLQSKKKGFQVKVDDYISKPFSSEILLLKVNNLVRSFNAFRQRISDGFYSRDFRVEKVASKDQVFLTTFDKALQKHFSNSDLKIDVIATELNLEKRALARYTERLLNQTPGQALKEYRLTRAMEMLKNDYTVTQCCFDCGFSSVAYFGSCFKQQFGCTPSSIKR